MNIQKMLRPEVRLLDRYVSSPPLTQISQEIGLPCKKMMKLDSGENAYISDASFYLYPDPLCLMLREKLATYCEVDIGWIACGNGSDELIDLVIRMFVSPGDEIIVNPPTFPMYAFYGKLSGAYINSVLRKRNLQVDTQKIQKAITSKTKLVFIDSPGNPTSVLFSFNKLITLLNNEVIVVVDEAYFEYCGITALPLLKKYNNLVILRTFSKWAGLAGLRIGYMVASPSLIDAFLRVKPPYNVNTVAQEMAKDALANRGRILADLKQLTAYRAKACTLLSTIPQLKVFPSEGAYLLFQPKTPAVQLLEYLKKNGVLAKKIDQPRLRNCIRMNVCKEKDMKKITSLIRRFYEN